MFSVAARSTFFLGGILEINGFLCEGERGWGYSSVRNCFGNVLLLSELSPTRFIHAHTRKPNFFVSSIPTLRPFIKSPHQIAFDYQKSLCMIVSFFASCILNRGFLLEHAGGGGCCRFYATDLRALKTLAPITPKLMPSENLRFTECFS